MCSNEILGSLIPLIPGLKDRTLKLSPFLEFFKLGDTIPEDIYVSLTPHSATGHTQP